MITTVVTDDEELLQIASLSDKNLRTIVSAEQQLQQGFITWKYSYDLLKQLNDQHPHIIAKVDDKVVGYALVALKDAAVFHSDLKTMIAKLDEIEYQNKKLSSYQYYVMGQICIDEAYRGKGVFEKLYNHHKKLLQNSFDFVVTEISTQNQRSIHAHNKIGFITIDSYKDVIDKWNVVLWNWL